MPSSDHVKADAGARRVEEPLHGQIRLYNVKSAEAGKLAVSIKNYIYLMKTIYLVVDKKITAFIKTTYYKQNWKKLGVRNGSFGNRVFWTNTIKQ